jgi:hypothetical protein
VPGLWQAADARSDQLALQAVQRAAERRRRASAGVVPVRAVTAEPVDARFGALEGGPVGFKVSDSCLATGPVVAEVRAEGERDSGAVWKQLQGLQHDAVLRRHATAQLNRAHGRTVRRLERLRLAHEQLLERARALKRIVDAVAGSGFVPRHSVLAAEIAKLEAMPSIKGLDCCVCRCGCHHETTAHVYCRAHAVAQAGTQSSETGSDG